ncbi:MAG TPA: ATP-binding protein, partial [Pyrinomonadaceae bacterium]
GDGAKSRSGDVSPNGDEKAVAAASPNLQSHYEANVPGLLKSGGANTRVEGKASVEEVGPHEQSDDEQWAARVLALEAGAGSAQIEDEPLLRERGWEVAYPLRREERVVGLMLVDAAPEALTYEVRSTLELLAGQVAIAIEDSRLVEENVRLERRIAQSERLAALGRMAATVAHEVKNPLSAIKSIAQVLREDDYLKREYARDLELIVGETDRLSRSVTQMLSFARTAPQADEPRRAGELLDSVVMLFRREAAARNVTLKADLGAGDEELDGAAAASLRDALTNLLLNALHATPAGGRVQLAASAEGGRLTVSVTDTGPGVAPDQRPRIWEPFYTTKQRGTGLGLAIVRKRIEEVGGQARLAPSRPGEGARFELTLPLKK